MSIPLCALKWIIYHVFFKATWHVSISLGCVYTILLAMMIYGVCTRFFCTVSESLNSTVMDLYIGCYYSSHAKHQCLFCVSFKKSLVTMLTEQPLLKGCSVLLCKWSYSTLISLRVTRCSKWGLSQEKHCTDEAVYLFTKKTCLFHPLSFCFWMWNVILVFCDAQYSPELNNYCISLKPLNLEIVYFWGNSS